MTETAIVPAEQGLDLALLKAVGLDRAAPEQRQLAIAIADRYGLDLMLKHLVLIEGRPYVTRDALIHIAHRSGQFDGISVTQPVKDEGYWRASCSVYRKDMSHPFTYGGRYPATGGNAKFAEEMCIKVAESMALRRAFDVAAPVVEERWDVDTAYEPPTPKPTLAERAAAKVIDLPPAEPLSPEVRATYVNADELAGGAQPVLRLPPSDPPPPWTRDRLHAAATKAGIAKQTAEVFGQVAEGRPVAALSESDWREMAVRLGLEPA